MWRQLHHPGPGFITIIKYHFSLGAWGLVTNLTIYSGAKDIS
ncbi:MAG TPA: hypothetical protein VD815_06130 [Candidatus Saccharimonadales bacterium]|nr:hypothetical protein [Candidatus Saccharimonadales bacterium]